MPQSPQPSSPFMPTLDPMTALTLGADPNDVYELQRRQMLAQMLGSAATSSIQPENYGPIRSRASPLSGLARLAEAYMYRKQMQGLTPLQTKVWDKSTMAFNTPEDDQALANRGQVAPGTGAPPAARPSGVPGPPVPGGAAPPAGPAAMGGAPQPAAGPVRISQPGAPMTPAATDIPPPAPPVHPNFNPLGLPRQLAMRAFFADPAKYTELIAGPNEWRNLLMATGGDPRLASSLAFNKAIKDGAIELRPGGEAIIRSANGQLFRLRNPNLPQGVEPVYSPEGEVTGARTIPGAAAAETEIARAGETGRAQGGLHTFPTQGGGETPYFGLPSNLPGVAGTGAATGGPAAGAGGGGAAPGAPPVFPGAPNVPPNFFAGAARQPGQPAMQDPLWQTLPKRQMFSGFGHDPRTTALNQKEVDQEVGLRERYGEESDLADMRMAFNNMALDSLSGAETGPLADKLTHWRAAAQEMGVPEALIPGWAKVAPTQELKKALVRNAIVSLKPSFGGRPAAAEFKVLKEEASPSDQMVQLAIKRLLEVDNELGGYQKQRAADFDQAMEMGGSALRFPTWYSIRRPMATRMENFLHPPTLMDVNAEIQRRARAMQNTGPGPVTPPPPPQGP